jgi:hypothetical protein
MPCQINVRPRGSTLSWTAVIQNVTTATASTYNATDSAGNGMDCAKIIQDPNGGYIAVYHVLQSTGLFNVYLATSTDLIHWTYRAILGTQASQPTIQFLSNGGFLVLWEAVNSSGANNHIRFNYYSSRANLLAGTTAQTFDAPQTLSTCAEGTPSIYSVTLSPNLANSVIDVGGHYNANCSIDAEQRGKLINFTTWVTAPATAINNAVAAFGVAGNIGDRDALNYRHRLDQSIAPVGSLQQHRATIAGTLPLVKRQHHRALAEIAEQQTLCRGRISQTKGLSNAVTAV